MLYSVIFEARFLARQVHDDRSTLNNLGLSLPSDLSGQVDEWINGKFVIYG